MKLSRQVGTVNEPLWVFIQDATVSTGVGLANVVASSVSFTWCRSDQAAVSTGTCTTGTMGTYSVSTLVQASSTGALGVYQFSPPNGIYTSGSSCILLLYGAPSMAPVPMEIEITRTANQTFTSSQTFSTALNSLGLVGSVNASTVTDKAGYGVSSVTTGVNVTSVQGAAIVTTAAGITSVDTRTILGSTPVTSSAGVLSVTGSVSASSLSVGVNITSIVGTAAVTSSAGILAMTWDLGRTANLTSTIALPGASINQVTSIVNVDKAGYGVSSVTAGVNVTSIVGTPAVTTSAGILATVFDLGRTANPNSTVAFSSMSISSQSVTVGGVNVTSIAGSPPVTTSAGVLSVAFDLGNILNTGSTVNLSALSISTVAGLNAATLAAIADKFLGRNVAGGSDTGRLVKEALYPLRNKVDTSTGIVYQTDDTTSSWAFTVSTQAGNPIVSIDPA